jgi:hypothetical protein
MPLYRIRELEKNHGDLHLIIPPLVNEVGQSKAAAKLGLSASTVSKWLVHNGYKSRVIFVRESEGKR